jgi:phosphoribosyl 1,2-cyclic phosphodiesterase
MSVRVCVLGSGSKGNCTLLATETTRLLVDAGLSCKETCARLEAIGEPADGLQAVVISHEHNDHTGGVRVLAQRSNLTIHISRLTYAAVNWDDAPKDGAVNGAADDTRRRKRELKFEHFTVGEKFAIGDIAVSPFSIPHDAADPVAFTFEAQGVRIGMVTDLGFIPEIVKQRLKGCHCLIFESNHDLEMLKMGPYPWEVKQRIMGRQGHLSNLATAGFLVEDFDGAAEVLVLAHLSETNNHPEIARLSAAQALEQRAGAARTRLYLASQTAPTEVFWF